MNYNLKIQPISTNSFSLLSFLLLSNIFHENVWLMTVSWSIFKRISCSLFFSIPTRSLFGPDAFEFQLKEYFEGQLVKPSWCLLVKTIYLNYNNSEIESFHIEKKTISLYFYSKRDWYT